MSINVNSLDDVVYVITNEDEVVYLTTIPNDIGQGPIQFQDEGANVGTAGAVSTIDFVGSTVSLALVGGKLTVTISSAGGGGVWGSITGTITNQSDLITLLGSYLTTVAAAAGYQPLDSDLTAIAAISPSNDDIIQRKAGAWTNRTMAQLGTDLSLSTYQLLVNSATALVDGATIDLTAIKHTLACSLGRTFTISYTGDDITLIITLSATSATFTFPAATLCVTNGTASGDNTMAFTGVTSGDKLVIAIKKVGTDYCAIGKNFGQQ